MRSAISSLILLALAGTSAGVPWTAPGPTAAEIWRAGGGTSNLLAQIDALPLPDIVWEENLPVALRRAAAENRRVLLYASMPNCGPCRMLEDVTFRSPAVRERLRELICVRIDILQDRRTALSLGIEGTPTLVMLTPDGEERGRFTGFRQPPEFLKALSSSAGGGNEEDAAQRQKAAEVLGWLRKGSVPPEGWPDVLLALGMEQHRPAVAAAILAMSPAPRAELVGQLAQPGLAVRLGALEMLEQLAGDDYGFDPWEDPAAAGEPPTAPLERWRAWAAGKAAGPPATYTALTREQILARLNDLLSDDPDRVRRARRALARGGPAVAELASEFLAQRPDLAAGLADRVREIRYATLLSYRAGFDAMEHARRLVFGNLDVRMQALRDIRAQKAVAGVIAREFLANPNPLLRETAVDVLLAADRRAALPLLGELVSSEQNREVIIAVARGLRAVNTRAAAALLTGLLEHPDEDIVLAALNSLSKVGSLAAPEAICKNLTDSRWRVRVAALQTVSELGIREAAETVEQRIGDEDAFVRYTAILTMPKVADHTRAIKRLEQAFLENDENKPAVLAAYGSLSAPIPAAFIKAADGKPPEVLLPMLDALSGSGKRGVAMAQAFANHPDADVACAALSLLARHGERSANAALVEALQRGGRGAVLAVLESLKREEEESRTVRISKENDMAELLSEIEIARQAPAASPGALAAQSAVRDLFDAFLGVPAPAAPAPTAGPPVAIGDLFDAFGAEAPTAADEALETPAAAGEPPPEPQTALLEAIRSCRGRFPGDTGVQGAALLAMLRMGDTNSLADLSRVIDDLPDDQKVDLGLTLKGRTTPEVLTLLKRLLVEREAATRTAAAETLVESCHLPEWCDALFDELTRTGTPLRLHEAVDRLPQRESGNTAARTNLRRWAGTLETAESAPLKVLAATLYGQAAFREDAARVLPMLDAEDPRLRREAYWTLMKLAPSGAPERVARAADDPSEEVRALVPAALSRSSFSWVHRFSETESVSSWRQRPDSMRLKELERGALRKLAADPLADLRAASMIAMLTRGEPFDAAELMSALGECRDSVSMSIAAGDALTSNYAKLDPGYAPLLPLLDAARASEETREKVAARLLGTPAVTTLPAGAAPIVRSAPVAQQPAAATEPLPPRAAVELRLVFFYERGCEECEQAKPLLAAMQESFPELQMEQLDIQQPVNRKFNIALCDKFQAPERHRLRTPTVVAGAGYLVGDEITFDRLADLLARSLDTPLTEAAGGTQAPSKPAAEDPVQE